MSWRRIEDPYWDEVYEMKEEFNGDVYSVFISCEHNPKSVRYWVSTSSGKKRKHREIFEEKESKSKGGIKALLWIKDKVLEFPKWYNDNQCRVENKKEYICVHWTDSKRRNVYSRLQNYGFKFTVDGKYKILMKRV